MGWTETMYYNKLSHKERREEMDKLYTWENDTCTVKPLSSTIKNNVYYGAIERVEKQTGERTVTCAITLLSVRKEGLVYWYGYKDMDETMGVNGCYDCPKKILDLLTPTTSECANKWREKCREQSGKPKLSNLKEGTIIEFICPWDTSACAKGDTVRLEKKCRTVNWCTGRKSYSWVGMGYRWKSTMIPCDFRIIGEV